MESIKNLFLFINSVSIFLETNTRLNLNWYGVILVGMVFLLTIESKVFPNEEFEDILSFIFRSYMALTLIMFTFKKDKIYLPKIITNNYKTPQELFKSFSHIAFLYGLTLFSLFVSIYLSAFIQRNILFAIELFYFTSSFFAAIWFSYHIVFKTAAIKKIKVRLHYYLAIVATFALISAFTPFESTIKVLITSYGCAFAWVKYLIEIYDYNESKKIADDSLLTSEIKR